jgi:hypothetical protein
MFAISLELITQFTNPSNETGQVNELDFKNSLVLISGSMSTASFASLLLGFLLFKTVYY